MKKYNGDIKSRVPIFSWCEEPEEGALNQAIKLSELPFIYKHVALMPDTHQGYGMPIGGVIACNKVIIPNAVGVDIGCGMCAVQLECNHIDTEVLKTIMGRIRDTIPVGFNHHDKPQKWIGWNQVPEITVIQQQLESAKHQLGTLGGGNHFIEFQQGNDGHVWIMLHSGSRNLGYQIAKYYNKLAQQLCERWYSNIPTVQGEDGLAFLPIESKEGKEYFEAMKYALKFAEANRFQIMVSILSIVHDVTKYIGSMHPIDVPHNYARWENHYGKNVIVHRKGATSAKEGELGIIPGSQGTSSYIVHGKGNVESFKSCSHGAGRAMSRSKARSELNLEQEIAKLDSFGIIHSIRNKEDLDEASSAYKDIETVMKEQEDLVDIHIELKPLAVIKG